MTWYRKIKKQRSKNGCVNDSEKFSKDQNTFPHPVKNDIEKLTGNSCKGIAYQLEINSRFEDNFGNLSIELAILILNQLAENMKKNETLAEYFLRKA